MNAHSLPSAPPSQRQWRRRYYRAYTLAFGLTALVVFGCFLHSDYSLICKVDSWTQHYKALCWYGQYLRQIARTLLHEHRLVIPNFDFFMGEGSDVLGTMHYYVIGDPIALFSVLVPQRFMHYFYSFSCVLRMYLAGLAFSALAIGTGKRSRHAILAGAISYAFCMWSLSSAARHPFFLDPAISLPLLILGIEKILSGRRPYLFVLTAAGAALSNFYFFYMTALLGVLYALIRLLMWKGPDWKQKLLLLLRMGLYALLGVGMAAVILLPVLLSFLGDSRASVAIPFRLFFPLSYYAELPAVALGSEDGSYWTQGGLSAPLLLALAALVLRRKQSPLLRVLLLVCGLFLIFPIFGRLFNGMSYSVNRWSWLIPLLGAYVLTDQWEGLHNLSRKELGRLLLFVLLLFGWMIFSPQSRLTLSIAGGFLLLLTLFVLATRFSLGRLHTQKLTVLLAAACVSLVGVWFFAPDFGNYMESCYANDKVLAERDQTEAHAIREIAYEAFPRFAAASITRNANILAGISSVQFYWSNSNPWLNRYKTELELNESTFSMSYGYDDRTVPTTLASVQYYSYPSSAKPLLPYGFLWLKSVRLREQRLEQESQRLREALGVDELSPAQTARLQNALGSSKLEITHNRWAMPLGYCYDRQLSRERWEALSALQRQQVQLDAVCVEDPRGEAGSSLPVWDGSPGDYALPYEIEYLSDAVSPVEGGLICTGKNAKIRLHFKGLPNAESYLRLEELSFVPVTEAALYSTDRSVDPLDRMNPTDLALLTPTTRLSMLRQRLYGSDGHMLKFPVRSSAGIKTELVYRSADNNYSAGRSSFLVNLGYQEEPLSSVTLTLPRAGRYCFRDLQILAVSMDGFGEKIDALRADCLEQPRRGTDAVYGEIRLSRPKLLVVTLPYSAGWTALVDGKPAPVLLANGRYLGLDLSAGHHEIELHYATPYLRAGALISAAALLVFALFVVLTERRRKRKTKN